jgi:hypothetical protein
MNRGVSVLFTVFLICLGTIAHAQREYRIGVTETPPIIDGAPTEEVWKKAEIATDFTVKDPVFGGTSEFVSKIRMMYDNNALYVSGEMYDPNPDSVSYSLSPRDDFGNADWFALNIDTYGKSVNAFNFMITAAGVELDAIEGVTNLDFSWNAVWRSATKRTEYGWSFEMKIPYSALRFPNQNIQEWNVNFWRSVRRRRENSTWNPVNPQVFGEITQSGKIIGIENIKSPLRLSFTPYATGYLENSYDEELDAQTWKRKVTGGMDLKFGLNDAFTLDMTLIPDFGQTTSDRQVLNLGPFEVQFNENRPFFLEGTDLFRTGGIFYSRRIAATPYYFYDAYDDVDESIGEEVVNNPNAAPMINGTKVSGRTKGGLGIGVFNAVEGKSEAIIIDSLGNERRFATNPLTNYNVFVLSQNLKNNSTVSFVNTNVLREGGARDANVSSADANIYSADGKYRVSTRVNLSAIKEVGAEMEFGHALYASIGKVGGVWQYRFNYSEESETYDPNDLGFLYNNNSREYGANLSWNSYTPTKRFFRRSVNLYIGHEELYKPQLTSYNYISLNVGGLHKKQVYTNLNLNINPVGGVDHFESRQFGKEVINQPNANIRWFFTTDYSKVFALDGVFSYQSFFGESRNGSSISLSPRVRISDRINVRMEASVNFIENDYGYVASLDEDYDDLILLGVRDRTIVENTLVTEFIFTKRMGIDMRVRHYWQEVHYEEFLTLLDEGVMIDNDYSPLEEDGESSHNTSYNAFTVDFNYRWVFLPGSELRVVYKNNIFHSKNNLDVNYFDTFGSLFQQPRINSVSLRVLFFIDALYFRGKKKRNAQAQMIQ